ncbi:MAG TPA: glycosyltransferase family 87 protein [Humisphaera sp.]
MPPCSPPPFPQNPHIFTPDKRFALIPPRAAADPGGIDTSEPIVLFPALRRSSYRRRLWMLAAGVALFLAIATGGEMARRAAAAPKTAADGGVFALDFIAFYTGGTFVREGRHRELFDIPAVAAYQHELARQNGADLGTAVGPWWNPPFYAWVFAPLSRLPFGVASNLWVAFNVACAAAACWMLARTLPRGLGWRTYALVPVLVFLSTPFIHAVTHGQNACTSLLIVTGAVTLWRAERRFLAGLVAGLMFYKPQHAAVLGAVMTLTLGWRVAAGMAVTGVALLLVTVVTLPGALTDFLTRMPANVVLVQEGTPYLWDRHATLKAFWRLLVQGPAAGPQAKAVTVIVAACAAVVGVLLLRLTACLPKLNRPAYPVRNTPAHRDRVIAATFLATPLLVPFYFDYDLLMLAVPAVLLAHNRMTTGRAIAGGRVDRCFLVVAPFAYAWLMLNADVAEKTTVNLTVPLLAVLTLLVAWPGRARAAEVPAVESAENRKPQPLARAA